MKARPLMLLFLFLFVISSMHLGMLTVECSEVHDVAIIDFIVFSGGAQTVPPHIPITANVTVENQGTVDESFNVTLYFGNATIDIVDVANLQAGSRTNVTFEWSIFLVRIMIFPPPWEDPMKVIHKNVMMKAEASIVPGEIDIADNVYVDGVINAVWLVPDVNGDGNVDMRDLGAVARHFGVHSVDPEGPLAIYDFNSDGKIDMRDVGVSARLFGVNYN